MFYVYMYKNKINGKIYVGKTNDLECRKKAHSRAEGSCPIFHRAIKKYGIDVFDFIVLGEFEQEIDVFSAERYYIDWFKTNVSKWGDKYGYNLTDGGDGISGYVVSQAQRDKQSKRMKLKYSNTIHPLKGKVLTEETKNKLRQANLGKKLTDETKQKISLSLIGEKNHNFGKSFFHTKETKNKMSLAKLGEKNHNFGKPMSNEQKAKLLAANIGRELSKEHKKNISESMMGEKNHFYGKTHSDKTKQKISQARIGKCRPHIQETKNKIGFAHQGSKSTSAKLNETKVVEIKKLLEQKELSQQAIANLYGVSRRTIGFIQTGQTWKHVKVS